MNHDRVVYFMKKIKNERKVIIAWKLTSSLNVKPQFLVFFRLMSISRNRSSSNMIQDYDPI